MDGWMDGWMDAWMDGHKCWQKKKLTDVCVDGLIC